MWSPPPRTANVHDIFFVNTGLGLAELWAFQVSVGKCFVGKAEFLAFEPSAFLLYNVQLILCGSNYMYFNSFWDNTSNLSTWKHYYLSFCMTSFFQTSELIRQSYWYLNFVCFVRQQPFSGYIVAQTSTIFYITRRNFVHMATVYSSFACCIV